MGTILVNTVSQEHLEGISSGTNVNLDSWMNLLELISYFA